MITQKVTERDFRRPELRDENPEDYEFRPDGQLARKDRWERAVIAIRFLVGVSGRDFEIDEILDAVKNLVTKSANWVAIDDDDDLPPDGANVNIRLDDGSVLNNVIFSAQPKLWTWEGGTFSSAVTGWQKRSIKPSVLEFHTK